MLVKQWGGVLLLAAVLLLTACDVVRLDASGKLVLPAQPGAKASFDSLTPQQIAQQTWQKSVLDAAHHSALDVAAFSSQLKSSDSQVRSYFLQVTAPVAQVDISNEREQSLILKVNNQLLAVQVGPVIRGNAIRDATGFRFEDFTNQVQFAQLSKAYNQESATHLPKLDNSWMGRNVTVLMAVSMENGHVQDAAALDLKQETP